MKPWGLVTTVERLEHLTVRDVRYFATDEGTAVVVQTADMDSDTTAAFLIDPASVSNDLVPPVGAIVTITRTSEMSWC